MCQSKLSSLAASLAGQPATQDPSCNLLFLITYIGHEIIHYTIFFTILRRRQAPDLVVEYLGVAGWVGGGVGQDGHDLVPREH